MLVQRVCIPETTHGIGNRERKGKERNYGVSLFRQQRSRSLKVGRTQTSTFSSSVIPVLTSKSSGARYAIVHCSAAISYQTHYSCSVLFKVVDNMKGRTCSSKAIDRFSTLTLAFLQLPKSIKIGCPSSETITFLPHTKFLINSQISQKHHKGDQSMKRLTRVSNPYAHTARPSSPPYVYHSSLVLAVSLPIPHLRHKSFLLRLSWIIKASRTLTLLILFLFLSRVHHGMSTRLRRHLQDEETSHHHLRRPNEGSNYGFEKLRSVWLLLRLLHYWVHFGGLHHSDGVQRYRLSLLLRLLWDETPKELGFGPRKDLGTIWEHDNRASHGRLHMSL